MANTKNTKNTSSKTKTVAKTTTTNIVSKAQFQDFCKIVNLKQDFAVFKANRMGSLYQVEPKRDLIMKVIAYFQYSYDTELTNIIEGKESIRYVVKAKVWKDGGRSATGLGVGSNKERSRGTEGREDHDAAASAETRALKRAVEGLSGFALVNQVIQHYFNDFKVRPEKVKELGLGANLR